MNTLTGRPTRDAAREPVNARNWREHRACADTHPDVFTDDDKRVQAYAKEICAQCPVKAFCLQLALDTKSPYGVFGGMTPEERRAFACSSGREKRVEDVLDAIVAARREGASWERIGRQLGFPAGTMQKRVEQWMRHQERAGRSVPEEFAPRRAGLSEAQVLEMRRRAQQGESDTEQALRTGMAKSSVRKIVTGECYQHFGGPLRKKRQGHASRPSLASCTEFNNGKASAYREVQELAS
jgi:WhiB family redox-sensing transcriptional regulator